LIGQSLRRLEPANQIALFSVLTFYNYTPIKFVSLLRGSILAVHVCDPIVIGTLSLRLKIKCTDHWAHGTQVLILRYDLKSIYLIVTWSSG